MDYLLLLDLHLKGTFRPQQKLVAVGPARMRGVSPLDRSRDPIRISMPKFGLAFLSLFSLLPYFLLFPLCDRHVRAIPVTDKCHFAEAKTHVNLRNLKPFRQIEM